MARGRILPSGVKRTSLRRIFSHGEGCNHHTSEILLFADLSECSVHYLRVILRATSCFSFTGSHRSVLAMKKKTALTKMHIAPSTVCYDAVAARDSNEVGLILAAVRKKNGYSLVAFSKLLYNYGVDVSDKGISKWEKGYTTPSIYQLVAICYALNIKEGPSYFTRNFQKPALLNDIGQKSCRV